MKTEGRARLMTSKITFFTDRFRSSRSLRTWGASFLIVGILNSTVFAFLNEALSIAFEIAAPYVEKDKFAVREDNWSGEIPAGESKLIRHQLFRGNEYWFWLGSSFENAKVTVEIFDSEGNPVGVETFAEKNKAGVRLLPPKTAVYFIRITVADANSAKGETLDWGLVYGYR
ncbi:hypothetical protein OAK81_02710 [Verrucomicrobiales bacterium]|nr:hypothetical protein [Verrucomicrobiales bacterium]